MGKSRTKLVRVDGHAGDAGDCKVKVRDRVAQPARKGQHEAAQAGVGVARHAARPALQHE